MGLIAIALVAAGCAEDRRFAKQGATRDTGKLVVPARITPPVTVARIEGTPALWRLNARVAKALRERDVPAGVAGHGKASYILAGRAERLAPAAGSAAPRLRIAWTLRDARGRRVGGALQIAAHPVAAGARLDGNIDSKPDPVALDRLARIAAERLTPLVPHAGLQAAAGNRADDPIWGRVAGAPPRHRQGPPVTALGKQDALRGDSGLSARFLKLRNVTGVGARSPEERIARKRAAAGPHTAATPAATPAVKPAAKPVIKPAQAEVPGLTKDSVVTERIAYAAAPALRISNAPAQTARAPAQPAKARARTAKPPRAAVTAVAAAGRRSPRAEVLRKDHTVRPAPGARKFPSAAAAGRSTRARPVQVAEAAGGRDDGAVKGFWVQLASNPSPKASRAAWEALVAAHGALLDRQPHAINRADLGRKGVYYRLQLGPYPNIAQAKRICASLQAAKVACLLMAARGQVASRGPAARKVVTEPRAPSPKARPRRADPPKVRSTTVETPQAPTGKTPSGKAPSRKTPSTAKAAPPKPGGGKAVAGKASALRPAAGLPKAKPDPKSGDAPPAARASARKDDGAGANGKAGLGARAEKPESRAHELPFQRSKALPGLPD